MENSRHKERHNIPLVELFFFDSFFIGSLLFCPEFPPFIAAPNENSRSASITLVLLGVFSVVGTVVPFSFTFLGLQKFCPVVVLDSFSAVR